MLLHTLSKFKSSDFFSSGTHMDKSEESMVIPRKGRHVVGGMVFSEAMGIPRS